MEYRIKKIASVVVLMLALTLSTYAQVESTSDLYTIIKANDSLLFEVGFNTCDIDQFEKLLSEDFVFYHDQNGITNSKSSFIESIQNGLCVLPYKPVRSLDEPTMEVFPLYNEGVLYGAIQNGTHEFYALKKDNQKCLTSVAQFTHVWVLKGDAWKLLSGLSFDHLPIEKPINDSLLFKDNEATRTWLNQKSIAALGIGFIEDGRLVQASVFGDLEEGHPAPLNTMWNVASLAKPITALLTLKLIDAGLWSLDEPIDSFYTDPDVAHDPRVKKLTTRLILSHQSGFPNWKTDSADGKLGFEFEPGAHYQYSGAGYDYLRKALEAKFDKSLEVLAEDLIFGPLGMADTKFVWDESMDAKPYAKWHKANGELYETIKYTEANAADDLLTTIEDYSKFVQFVLEGANLSDSLLEEMSADQVRVSDFKHFGLGWWIDENINEKGDYALVHGGDDIGVHCIVFILPHSKEALLIFTNSDNGTDAYVDVITHYLRDDAEGIFNAEMN